MNCPQWNDEKSSPRRKKNCKSCVSVCGGVVKNSKKTKVKAKAKGEEDNIKGE